MGWLRGLRVIVLKNAMNTGIPIISVPLERTTGLCAVGEDNGSWIAIGFISQYVGLRDLMWDGRAMC